MLSLGGLPILGRILNRPSPLTGTKAFREVYEGYEEGTFRYSKYIVTEQCRLENV